MSRVFVVIGVMAIAAGFGWAVLKDGHQIVVRNAVVSRMMDGAIMVSAEITNAGAPDVLVGASAKGFHHVHLMGMTGDLVIPGGAAPVLAGDGTHIMMASDQDLAIGELVPMVLSFKDAGEVTVRAQIGDAMMDHSKMPGIQADDVTLRLRLDGNADRAGALGVVDIEGLKIVARPDGTGHIDGEGHAHVYLNGLKLQRLYQASFETGALRAGKYLLQVTLNSNDHRPYVIDGTPISSELTFTVE